jgi:hypothetical protein
MVFKMIPKHHCGQAQTIYLHMILLLLRNFPYVVCLTHNFMKGELFLFILLMLFRRFLCNKIFMFLHLDDPSTHATIGDYLITQNNKVNIFYLFQLGFTWQLIETIFLNAKPNYMF